MPKARERVVASASPKTSATPEPVLEAMIAVSRAPADRAAWDHLEAVAIEQRNPAAVAEAFRKALAEPHPPALLLDLGERAARFQQEWLADRPGLLVEVLERVLEVDPSADWAWKRLVVVLTLEERWDQLLGAYDRALKAITERARRTELLEEAAQVAKDFVGDANRAVGYLQLLLDMRPGDWQVAAAIERLLERQERWRDLVALWRGRIGGAAPDTARALRLRIATTELDRLADPAAALAEARRLLEGPGTGAGGDHDDDTAAATLALVER